jgi:hypothetical protein
MKAHLKKAWEILIGVVAIISIIGIIVIVVKILITIVNFMWGIL